MVFCNKCEKKTSDYTHTRDGLVCRACFKAKEPKEQSGMSLVGAFPTQRFG